MQLDTVSLALVYWLAFTGVAIVALLILATVDAVAKARDRRACRQRWQRWQESIWSDEFAERNRYRDGRND